MVIVSDLIPQPLRPRGTRYAYLVAQSKDRFSEISLADKSANAVSLAGFIGAPVISIASISMHLVVSQHSVTFFGCCHWSWRDDGLIDMFHLSANFQGHAEDFPEKWKTCSPMWSVVPHSMETIRSRRQVSSVVLVFYTHAGQYHVKNDTFHRTGRNVCCKASIDIEMTSKPRRLAVDTID